MMDTSFKLTNLVGNSKYRVVIYAATIAGTGTESSIEFTTEPGPRKSVHPVPFPWSLICTVAWNSTSLLS